MSKTDLYILRGKSIILLVVSILLISSGLEINNLSNSNTDNYTISYENINIRHMATANVSTKQEVEKPGVSGIIDNYQKMVNAETPKEIELPAILENESLETNINSDRIWYLPCEVGIISGGVSYYHYALDIVSPRGVSEAIYPVANGVISSIYTDYAGALIVTVNHNINGNLYTSQYVHLSRYEEGIYVGKEVTVNDRLGYMGSTGIAYGTHLHLALLDCNSFSSDNRCSNLGSFFYYGKSRYNQGFYGLQSVMDVPASWTSR